MPNEIPQPTLALMEMLKTLAAPAVHALIEQSRYYDETIQFYIAKIREVQELSKKWRTEFPGSDIAERCASDVEALVIQPE
jgi:hypothetical protein